MTIKNALLRRYTAPMGIPHFLKTNEPSVDFIVTSLGIQGKSGCTDLQLDSAYIC